MLDLNDPRWKKYKGGYGVIYDASVPLRRLFEEGASQPIWDELWQELHHQGDIGAASYAAVPHLLEFARRSKKLDWNVFGLVATIEMSRDEGPKLPKELAADYLAAIGATAEVLVTHPDRKWGAELMQVAATCLALTRGQRKFAEIYSEFSLQSGKRWLKAEFD
ncbi:MAG: hypothetical protein J5I93_08710 [Pirellulaceae bacterium]|nr:hypothetical protein [Pirellulaceae bacterium]